MLWCAYGYPVSCWTCRIQARPNQISKIDRVCCRYSDVVDMGPSFAAALKKELATAIKPFGASLPVSHCTADLQ